MKFFFKLIAILLCCVLTGTLLLGAAFSIPTKYIEPHVELAAEIIKEEGLYHEITKVAVSIIDNWTDSIMLMEAMYPNGEKPFINAMKVYRYEWGDGFPNESLIHYFESDGQYDWIEEYPNYWHGYLVFLKPLLVFFGYEQIRFINGIAQTLASLCLCVVLWKKGIKEYIVPFLLCVCILMPIALAKCMQYSTCFYIMVLGSIAMLTFGKDKRSRIVVFLCIGIATSYFDFLTYPIATFGVPAVFCLNSMEPSRPEPVVKKFIVALGVWILGYSGMWLGKFAVGSLITGENLFAKSMGHVLQWTGGGARFSLTYVLYFNIRDFVYTPAMVAALIYTLSMVITIIKNKKFIGNKAELVEHVLPYLFFVVLPFVYYIIMLNPSGVHFALFSHKSLVVTAFAGLSMLVRLKLLVQGKNNYSLFDRQ